MNEQQPDNSVDQQIDSLEASVNQLVTICNKLTSENAAFKKSNRQLLQDRSDLLEKNDKAQAQVEAMISRLKAMDSTS